MNKLAEIRKNKKLSQQAVADYLQITRQAYANYEGGRREANYETMLKISEFFDCSIDELFGRDKKADVELNEYLDELRNRSEMRMLFSVAKGATKEDVERAVAIIEALRNQK